MNTSTIATLLYAVIPLISTIGWFPQIARLVRRPQLGAGMSIPTWSLWTLAGIISLAYTMIVIGDILLSITFIINVTGQGTILLYAIIASLRYSKE